jgi:excisionase family DNA binding protein
MSGHSQFESLTELQQNVDAVPVDKIPAVLAQLAAVQSTLAARLLQNGNGTTQDPKASAGKLLTVQEAAERTGMSKDWLYRNSSKLPFVVKVGRSLRFSEAGLEKWIRSRSGR